LNETKEDLNIDKLSELEVELIGYYYSSIKWHNGIGNSPEKILIKNHREEYNNIKRSFKKLEELGLIHKRTKIYYPEIVKVKDLEDILRKLDEEKRKDIETCNKCDHQQFCDGCYIVEKYGSPL
jgi:hypothetical protein